MQDSCFMRGVYLFGMIFGTLGIIAVLAYAVAHYALHLL